MTDTRQGNPPDVLARRPTGAPHALDRIVGNVAGVPVTAEERVLDAIRFGNFIDAAAGVADVDRTVLHDWLAKGATANRKAAEGKRLTASEHRYAAFANKLYQAEAEAEVREVSGIYRVGVGGGEVTTRTTVTTRGEDGKTSTSETVKVQELPPDPRAMQWHAERRWASKWNRRQQIEVSGPEGGPIKVESPLASLMSTLDAMERRQHSIDTAGREVGPVEEVPDDGG